MVGYNKDYFSRLTDIGLCQAASEETNNYYTILFSFSAFRRLERKAECQKPCRCGGCQSAEQIEGYDYAESRQ
jgi:hypothetical protein